MVPPQSGHLKWMSSTYGLWRSMSIVTWSSIALSISSCLDPTLSRCPQSSHLQIGNGVPQYLFLEIAQSFTFSSQLPNLFSPTNSGNQLTVLLFSTSLSFSFVISIYHDGFA